VVKWRFEIHILDVGSTKLCTRCSDGAVPKKLGQDHVSGLCGELKGVVDQVSSHCNTDAVGVLLLGMMVDDDPCIRDCSI
jgi:hypothetical protein